MLNQKLQLKLSQKLSPQQIQLMKLIQLSTLEFEQRLSTEIEENPALDTINENQEKENDDFELEDNFENEDILGSLEYSCKVAGSKLIVVLGHESCGAVKAACDGVELGNITHLLSNIKPADQTAIMALCSNKHGIC